MMMTSAGIEGTFDRCEHRPRGESLPQVSRWLAVETEAASDSCVALRKRAYRLARSGECKTVVEISGRLRIEGYSTSSIGAFLREKTCADLARIMSIADNT